MSVVMERKLLNVFAEWVDLSARVATGEAA